MFSVITPTYNRANTLYRVYDSLQMQTIKTFEWIIIDDASTDETEDLVKKWIVNNKEFEIKYRKLPENRGKPHALNVGFPLCTKKVTIIADSDDTFEPNTLHDLNIIWDAIDCTLNNKNIAAVWTLVKDENDVLVGKPFPRNYWQVGLNERVLQKKKQVVGEKWHSWRTSILQDYKMYHNPNSFVSEGATWNRINKDYDYLCINVIHRKYWFSQDGYIHEKKSLLKKQKVNYYTSYYQLKNTSINHIFFKQFYHKLAFNYVRALFYYRDKENCIKGLKLLITILLFALVLPSRIWHKFSHEQ